jgi:hypothetical protein
MNIACTAAKMSRDSALVMFFYILLANHVCNAMSNDLSLALADVFFHQIKTSTRSSDIFSYLIQHRRVVDLVRRRFLFDS